MSIAPVAVGLQPATGGGRTKPKPYRGISKSEDAFLAARAYEKACEKQRQEEQLKPLVKQKRKRTKQENKAAKAKAKAQVDGHTLEPKKGKGRSLATFVKLKVFRRKS